MEEREQYFLFVFIRAKEKLLNEKCRNRKSEEELYIKRIKNSQNKKNVIFSIMNKL